MMEELMIFQNEEFGEIRAQEIEGAPWFCLADVCRPLGIQTRDCRKRLKQDGVVTIHLTDSLGRPAEMLFVNEANLYRAIFQSRKAEAERFTDWVTEEVLPSIRRTGVYQMERRGALSAALDREAHCSTDARLRCLRQRRKKAGARRRDYMALTKLDAIAEDRALRTAFEGIVARETARAAEGTR